MAAHTSLLIELQEAIERGSSDRRMESLRRITDLFLGDAAVLNGEQVDVFDDVMGRLIDQIEMKALVELGQRLAPLSNAPKQVMRRLARNDAIAVAGPVLARSPRVPDADLIEIARTKSQAHLLAISGRAKLGIAVTDEVVRRGNPYVKRSVAANEGASLSPASFEALAASAEKDDTLGERMVRRADIPPHLFCSMLTRATEEVRQRFIAAARPEMHGEIRRVLDVVSHEIADRAPQTRDYGTAIQRLLKEYPGGNLKEREVAQFAAGRRLEETVASLSLIAGVPADMIDKLMHTDRLEPILIVCRSANFKWPTVRAIIQSRPGRTATPEALTEACDDFNKLSPQSAQQMVRYWQTRQSAAG